MDKQYVGIPYDGMLTTHENEVPIYAKTWMNFGNIRLIGSIQTHKGIYYMILFFFPELGLELRAYTLSHATSPFF
jgi:hypothetical protein